MTHPSPFKWFKTSPEIIRLAVMLYVRFPLSLRNFVDTPQERRHWSIKNQALSLEKVRRQTLPLRHISDLAKLTSLSRL